ncbi:MAG: GAF domain-containing protein [Vicinamibacterales bacterium]
MRRLGRVLLPLVTAGLALLVSALLLPITDHAWGPLMAPAVAITAWLGGWPLALATELVGLAGRMVVITPPVWERPLWTLLFLALHGAIIVFGSQARQSKEEREQARRAALERADRAQRAVAARRAAFLAHASEVLASSPDYETTLSAVANLAVPQIADLCIVDIVLEDGSFQALAVAHVDPKTAQLVRELRQIHPLDPQAPFGPPRVLRTGRSVVYSDIDQTKLNEMEIAPSELRVATALGIRSTMAVPLVIGGRRFGVISFATTESGRRFIAPDLLFAEDLARRAALAIDAARP